MPTPRANKINGKTRDDYRDTTQEAVQKMAATPDFPWGQYAQAIERQEAMMGRPAPHPVDEKNRLAPPFVEWMMGLPEGHTAGMSRTAALKALGNAVVPQQAILALATIYAKEQR